MKYLVFFLWSAVVFAAPPAPTPFPVFLKQGFSSVLEFDDSPTKIVLGDGNNFQVEKLERSLVVKTLAPYAVTNLFVYFEKDDPRLFVLTASEDAEPTYFRKFESPKPKTAEKPTPTPQRSYRRVTRIVAARFDKHKDYLSVLVEIAADSKSIIQPKWNLIRLTYNGKAIAPFKLWSERKDVQKDSHVRARFLFVKPNLPKDLTGAHVVIPVDGSEQAISLSLKGRAK